MIHFDVTEIDGDRELRLAGTDVLVGEIVQGRRMVDLTGTTWTEWAFVPAAGRQSPTFRAISPAYDAARVYAATLPPAIVEG